MSEMSHGEANARKNVCAGLTHGELYTRDGWVSQDQMVALIMAGDPDATAESAQAFLREMVTENDIIEVGVDADAAELYRWAPEEVETR